MVTNTTPNTDHWQLRARQIQRFYHADKNNENRQLITPEHLERAQLLQPNYTWKVDEYEPDWDPNWETLRSLRSLLSHKNWTSLPTTTATTVTTKTTIAPAPMAMTSGPSTKASESTLETLDLDHHQQPSSTDSAPMRKASSDTVENRSQLCRANKQWRDEYARGEPEEEDQQLESKLAQLRIEKGDQRPTTTKHRLEKKGEERLADANLRSGGNGRVDGDERQYPPQPQPQPQFSASASASGLVRHLNEAGIHPAGLYLLQDMPDNADGAPRASLLADLKGLASASDSTAQIQQQRFQWQFTQDDYEKYKRWARSQGMRPSLPWQRRERKDRN